MTTVVDRLVGAVGQCFACAVLERTLGQKVSFNYWNDVDRTMSIDLQFNCRRGIGLFRKDENVFIDVKTSLEHPNCTVQDRNPMLLSVNGNGHGYFMFLFRDESWIGICRSTDGFRKTFANCRPKPDSGYFIVKPGMFSDMSRSEPDSYWKMPLYENDGYGTTFGEFFKRYSGEFADFKYSGAGEGRYVNGPMLGFCRNKVGLNSDIKI